MSTNLCDFRNLLKAERQKTPRARKRPTFVAGWKYPEQKFSPRGGGEGGDSSIGRECSLVSLVLVNS